MANEAQPITEGTRRALVEICQRCQRQSQTLLQNVVWLRRQGLGRDDDDWSRVFDGFELAQLANFEIAAFLENMVAEELDLKANLFARYLLHAIYENSKSLRGLLNHEFRASVEKVIARADVDQALRAAHSRISQVFRDSDRGFGDVRNGIAGHRDADAETRIMLIEKTDAQPIADLAIAMLQGLERMSWAELQFWEKVRGQLHGQPSQVDR